MDEGVLVQNCWSAACSLFEKVEPATTCLTQLFYQKESLFEVRPKLVHNENMTLKNIDGK